MSEGSERDGPRSVLGLLDEWYHVPALLVVMVFMLWVRLQSYDNFIVDGRVLFTGNDAWYHLREVNYTVRNWPATMPFDPWTYFPYGTNAGHFGTLYDQLVATAALVVGLGAPSDQLVAKTLLVAPAVFGALAVVPTYLIGKRVAGRGAAVLGVVVLALLPGTFLQRTTVGFADHNGAEPFFMGMAVAALLVALSVAERDRPVWELVEARDWDELRTPGLWAAGAGVATALYMWTWPPGVLLVGVVGVYTLIKLPSDYVGGQSPDYVALPVAAAMGVTTLLMLVPLQRLGFGGATEFSLLQVFAAASVAVTAVVLAAIARVWDGRDLPEAGYPVAVGGVVLVAVVGAYAVLPGLYGNIANNLLRTVGFSAGAEARTIAEAQPFLSPDVLRQRGFTTATGGVDRVGRIMAEYGFTLFTGVVGAIWLATKPLVRSGDTRDTAYAAGGVVLLALLYLVPAPFAAVADALGTVPEVVGLALVAALLVGATLRRRYDADRLLFLVWAAFVAAAAFTQVRFNYYLVLVVATMNAYLVGELFRYLDLTSIATAVEDIDGYQVLAVLAVVMLVVTPGLIVPLQVRDTGSPGLDRTTPAWESARNVGPGGYTEWDDSLQWMQENTPREGNLGGADNADRFEYYGQYDRTDDFQYPEGTYGVQSWWDYGHWITVGGERVPNANPFQQGATAAANYLLAPDESAARETLASRSTEGERTRYVMVDWQMATPGSKFGAPITFYDRSNVSSRDFYHAVYGVSDQSGQARLGSRALIRTQRYYESLMTRLYYYHGSAQSPEPIVLDWEPRQVAYGGGSVTVNGTPAGGPAVKQFNSTEEARAYVRNDSTSQVGGVGPFPSERVPALEHYRLVDVSEESALDSTQYRRLQAGTARTTRVAPEFLSPTPPSYVKTFERVPGATVQGSGAMPNEPVTAEVPIHIPETNTTFQYSQRTTADENGEFTMTLPYATTGYDEYGPDEGYTDTSLRAEGPYNITGGATINDSGYIVAHQSQLDVSEGRVVGAEDGPTEVTLERRAQPVFGNQTAGSDGAATNRSALAAPDRASTGGMPADADASTADAASAGGGAADVSPAAVARPAGA
jgi:dolichyl-diphosphooligosaccharide--protein glycosyltransferase